MPQFLSSITIAPFSSASSQALAVNVSGDTNPRLKLDAGGRLTWGTGSSSGDVYLERSASSELTVTGKLSVSDAFKVRTVEIDPSSPSLNQVLQYNGTKFVSATIAGLSTPALDDLTDVTITSAEEFQSLQYNGTAWVNNYAPVVTYVRNAEATTLTTGTVVYLFGATGDHASVKRAGNGSDTTSSKTIGLVAADITASNNGPVVTRGYVDGIDLSTGYTAGDVLWLGTGGAFTTTKPTAPDHLVFVGVVVRATSNGIIYVATQNGYELDELHNVSLPSPTAGDFLKYNGTLWVADDVDLGTDTNGDYVAGVTGGTGVTVTGGTGEGSTPSIAIGQSVDTSATPSFSTVTSTVATGTAPLTVASTTVVTNLNADKLDGQDGSYYQNASNLSSGTLPAGRFPALTGDITTTAGSLTTAIAAGVIVNADINASAAIADTKLGTISTANKVSLAAIDIDGGTDIGAALVDADLIIVDDGGAGTNRKAAVTRISDYVFGKVSGDITVTSAGVATISNRVAPIGSMTMWAGTATGGTAPAYTSLPSGYLLCDGTAVSRTTYASLFAVIGTRYGSGDGSTTFNLPSLTTRVPIGLAASSSPTVPTTIATGNESANHTHTITSTAGNQSADHSHTYSGNTGNVSNGHTHNFQVYFNGGNIQTKATGDINHNHYHGFSGTTSGMSVSHNHTITSNAGNQSASHVHSTDATSVYFIIRFN